MRRSTARGTKPASSQASAWGFTSSSTKRRTWSRSISCSGSKKGERAPAVSSAGFGRMVMAVPRRS